MCQMDFWSEVHKNRGNRAFEATGGNAPIGGGAKLSKRRPVLKCGFRAEAHKQLWVHALLISGQPDEKRRRQGGRVRSTFTAPVTGRRAHDKTLGCDLGGLSVGSYDAASEIPPERRSK